MLLAMDVGNTETLIGLFGEADVDVPRGHGLCPREWRARARLSLAHVDGRRAHARRTRHDLDAAARPRGAGPEVHGDRDRDLLLGPAVTTQLRRMAKRWFSDLELTVLGPGHEVRHADPLREPARGRARTASPTPSARATSIPGPSIVVDMGTATVFDVISANGEYLGGAIAPGVAISLEALYTHAAALRSVELVRPRSVIGRSTVESIQSGVLYGFAAQVDGIDRAHCRRARRGHHHRHRWTGESHRAPHEIRAHHRTVVDPARIAYRS